MKKFALPADLTNIGDERKFLTDLCAGILDMGDTFLAEKAALNQRCARLLAAQRAAEKSRNEEVASRSAARQAQLKKNMDAQAESLRLAYEKERDAIRKEEMDARTACNDLVRTRTAEMQAREREKQKETDLANQCIRMLNAYENLIRCPAYEKILNAPGRAQLPSYSSFEEIMQLPLDPAVQRIQFLHSGPLQRLAAGGELKQLYGIIASARISAAALYARLDAAEGRLREQRAETQRTLQAANRDMLAAAARAEEALKPVEARYRARLNELQTKYNADLAGEKERRAAEQAEANKLNRTEAEQTAAEAEALRTNFQSSCRARLTEAYPPGKLRVLADRLTKQKNCRPDWTPASGYPCSIILGRMQAPTDFRNGFDDMHKILTELYGFMYRDGVFCLPLAVPFTEQYSMYLANRNGEIPSMENDLRCVCLEAFLSAPPGKLRFSFVDPVRSGKTFSVFQLFENDADPAGRIVPNGTMTETAAIENQLRLLSDQITNMNEKVFKGLYEGCANKLAKYNEDNPHTPRPYTVLAVADFPAHFSEDAVSLLEKIVATGGSCGIYTVIAESAMQMQAADAKVRAAAERLRSMLWQYEWNEELGGYGMLPPDGQKTIPVYAALDAPLSASEIQVLAPRVMEEIRNAGRVTVDYEHMLKPQSEWCRGSSLNGLTIPIGLQGSGNVQCLSLGQDRSSAVHGLVVGQTGSGKTGLLHAIIVGALLEYAADELEIYLVDYKSGVEFKIYTNYDLPSFRVVAIESEQEFGLSVLDYVMKEADRRAKLFKAESVNNITAYREHTGRKLPRILLIIDEFHELFNEENPSLARSASSKVDTILKLYRSFGIHVILSTQSLKGFHGISDGALAQIAVRIALKCPTDDARAVLGASAPLMNQIERDDAGSAVYSASNGDDINASMLFRTVYLTVDKIDRILADLAAMTRGVAVNTRVLISDVENSRANPLQVFAKSGDNISEELALHLGEPLKLESQMMLRFRMTDCNNLLLVGDHPQKAQDLLYYITLGALLQRHRRSNALHPDRVVVFNFCDDGETAEADIEDRLRQLALSFPRLIDYAIADNAEDTLSYVEEIFRFNKDAIAGGREDEVCRTFVILSNLRLCAAFQKDGIYEKPAYSRLMQLFAEGPQNGVFMIPWVDSLSLLTAKFPEMLRYCDYRIVFNMSPQDMMTLAGVENDSGINRTNAILFRQNKQNQKFRPYVTASREWFVKVAQRLEVLQEND